MDTKKDAIQRCGYCGGDFADGEKPVSCMTRIEGYPAYNAGVFTGRSTHRGGDEWTAHKDCRKRR